MLTNLKLVNVRLTKENMELREMLNNNKNSHDPKVPSCPTDMTVSKKKNCL